MNYSKELKVAVDVAKIAGEIQLSGLGNDLSVEFKDDTSPVTKIDQQCESTIYSAISKTFPDDGFLGEETGYREGSSGRKWIIDPLDGTRPYIRGIPTYSVLIALEENNVPVLGVIHLPGMAETYTATKGGGAFCNGNRIHVSNTSKLSSAMGSSLGFIEKDNVKESKNLLRLMNVWDYYYGFMDAYSYACLASGKIDVCISLLDKPWDCAAAVCVITEAGGKVSDTNGDESIYNGETVATNGILHDDVINFFKNRK